MYPQDGVLSSHLMLIPFPHPTLAHSLTYDDSGLRSLPVFGGALVLAT